MVSPNEITKVFKTLNIFRTAGPFSRVQIESYETPVLLYFENPPRDTLLSHLKMFHLVPSPSCQ